MDLAKVFSSVANKFSSAPNKVESYLAVKISSTSVVATTWTLTSGNVVLGPVFHELYQSDTFENLLHATDKVVSQALAQTNNQIFQVVYALPFHFEKEGRIAPEKLKELRAISKELNLEPIGYVSLTEALEAYFKETEGAPLTAILVGVEGKNTALTVYRAGRNLGTFALGGEVNHEDDMVSGIERALKKFTAGEPLPSRIILYDGKSDLTRLCEKVTAFPWTARLPFLHFPKVETISAEFVVRAVAVAAGMQQGGKPMLGQDFTESNVDSESVLSQKFSDVPIVESKNEVVFAEPENLETPQEFVSEEKEEEEFLPEEMVEVQEDEAINLSELEEVSPTEAGFVSDDMDEVTVELPKRKEEPKVETDHFPIKSSASFSELPSQTPVFPQTSSGQIHSQNRLPKFNFSFASVKNVFSKFVPQKKSLPQHQFQKPHSSQKLPLPLIGLVTVILMVFLGGLGVAAYFVPKAKIIVFLSGQSFDKTMEVTVVSDPNKTVTGKMLAGRSVVTSELGSRRAVATGKKLVGDKAKGGVTITNTSVGRFLPAGTVLSAGGMKYVTNNDVNIASGSSAVAPAKSSVNVTASDIGEKYNLASGTVFTVGSLSKDVIAAVNDAPISGGNSHQATVVTKDDQVRLLSTLTEELTNQATTALQNKVEPGQTLLPKAVTSSVTQKKFTKDVDSEADTFGLDLTLEFKGITFATDNMIDLFVRENSGEISTGYALARENARVDVVEAKMNKEGDAVLQVHLVGTLLPQINLNELPSQIAGKSPKVTQDLLTKFPGVTKIDITAEPSFTTFLLQKVLPWKKENIQIETVRQ